MNSETIASLFNGHGAVLYGDELVSQTEHALQCAMLAEQAGEPMEVIVAALLHDLGHFLMTEHGSEDLRHQEVAAAALQGYLSDAVIAPIRLHVAAKRYLCAVESDYWAALSQGSKDSLVLQGGPYDEAAVAAFRREPHFEAAVRLRRYDDAAKCVGVVTPLLAHFLNIMATALDRPHP